MEIISVLDILTATQNISLFAKRLTDIELQLNDLQKPIYFAGNNVVVFKVWWGNTYRAMRCYTHKQHHLKELYGDRFFGEEIYVYTGARSGVWIDVVLEEWREGVTLRERIEGIIGSPSAQRELSCLVKSFNTLSSQLLASDCAHGDLTAENILVSPTGEMLLVDFDCSFRPEFIGRNSPELGTAAYQPPQRSPRDFDRNIDDYSIALISTALSALSVDPTIYDRYESSEGLLFNPHLIAQGKCSALNKCLEIFLSKRMAVEYHIARLLAKGKLRIPALRGIFHYLTTPRTHTPSTPLLLVIAHQYVGYETPTGDIAIPCIYDDGLSFKNRIVEVEMAGEWWKIDYNGEWVEDV